MPAEFHRVKDIFLAVAEKPPAERAALLDEACGGDAELRARVAALLRAHDQPDSGPSAGGTGAYSPGAGEPPPAEQTGGRVGPYKLLQRLGEGGMGEVWMAEQHEPVKRRVAL